MNQYLQNIKKFFFLWKIMLVKPDNTKMFLNEYFLQCKDIGFGALPIVLIVSIFLGAVTTIQTAYQLVSPFVPISTIAQVVRDSMILELCPTVVCLMLAGIIGSKIASELGNMRITEQIDALEIMGINTQNYLILPKILAALTIIPVLIIISMFVGIAGGRLAGDLTGVIDASTFDVGLRYKFKVFNIIFALLKTYTYSLLISSIAAFKGYYTKGSALEIGRSSTKAVVISSIGILLADYILATLLL